MGQQQSEIRYTPPCGDGRNVVLLGRPFCVSPRSDDRTQMGCECVRVCTSGWVGARACFCAALAWELVPCPCVHHGPLAIRLGPRWVCGEKVKDHTPHHNQRIHPAVGVARHASLKSTSQCPTHNACAPQQCSPPSPTLPSSEGVESGGDENVHLPTERASHIPPLRH